MTPEQILREKLRKIEALFAGAATAGEKAAADAAADRIRARLRKATSNEEIEEVRFSVPDVWSRQLFIALCRRYGLAPFRYRRMGAVAELVGIECGVVSGVFNLESSGIEVPDWRPRHDKHYHEAERVNDFAPLEVMSLVSNRAAARA
jgi:hypothetical protein